VRAAIALARDALPASDRARRDAGDADPYMTIGHNSSLAPVVSREIHRVGLRVLLRGNRTMSSTRNASKAVAIAVITFFAVGIAGSAVAETQWEKDHPRRDQVNDRLKNQNKRIRKEVKEGEMTKAQAAKLHKDDRQIRQEERDMASQNGGHITKQEQRTLNQQENATSKQIGR
jgi:uncharacterized protein HemX